MFFKRTQKHQRKPSFHQKQMRVWTVMLIVLLVAVFAAAFYFLNRHYSQPGM